MHGTCGGWVGRSPLSMSKVNLVCAADEVKKIMPNPRKTYDVGESGL